MVFQALHDGKGYKVVEQQLGDRVTTTLLSHDTWKRVRYAKSYASIWTTNDKYDRLRKTKRTVCLRVLLFARLFCTEESLFCFRRWQWMLAF